MVTRYSRKFRMISILLCVSLVLGFVIPVGVRADHVSKVYDAEELSASKIPLIPVDLIENETFMSSYVNEGGRMSLNGEFSLYKSSNADGAGKDRLPAGVVSGNKSDKWFVSYKWDPTQAQRDVINRPDVDLYFKASMTPDYHIHDYFVTSTKHWSTSSIRLTRGDGRGGNTWTYGESDYGHRKNGDIIVSYGSKAVDDGEAQTVSTSWNDFPGGDKELFYNAYHTPGNMCGNPETDDAVFYAVENSKPTITSVEFSGDTYTAIKGAEVTETVTLRFSENIRFADNGIHDDLKLYLDAEYLSQSGETGSLDLVASLVEMGYDYLKFQFKVSADVKHIKVSGLSSDQPSLMQACTLKLYDGAEKEDGDDSEEYISDKDIQSTSLITDFAGNSLDFSRKTFARYFDGVAPELRKIEMSGPDISAVSAQPDSWSSNSGSNRFVYAGADDRITFQAVFDEDISIVDENNARAILSIKDDNGNPIALAVKRVSGNTVTFEDLIITQQMRDAGERISILRMENMDVTDYAGNALSTDLTAGLMVPSQDITLDVDKPMVDSTISTDQILSADPLVYRPYADVMGGEYFSFPVTFNDFNNNGADRSGIADMNMQFSLDLESGNSYGYQWAMDMNQAVTDTTKWFNGTTGKTNTYEGLAEGGQYWVHIRLDKNTDYDYTVVSGTEAPGVYFNGTLNFSGVSDWAGNRADSGISYTLRHQVDIEGPSRSAFASSISLIPDYTAGRVSFSANFAAKDNYCIKNISYRWLIKSYAAADFEYVDSDWTVVTPTGSGLNKELTISPSFTYDFGAAGAFRSGQVKLEVMVEDVAGNRAVTQISSAASFNYELSSSNSSIAVNDPTAPVAVPQVQMQAPYTPSGAQPENPPRSLLIIPLPESLNEAGEYTEFYIWDPWDWDTDGVENGTGVMRYVSDPIAAIENYLYAHTESDFDLAEVIRGSYYLAKGTVDLKSNSAAFTDLAPCLSREIMQKMHDFFAGYYGRMDLYIVTTSSLEEFSYKGYVIDSEGWASLECPKDDELNFNGTQSTVDTYTVYIANEPEYKVATESITNAQGLTDAENERYQLDYTSGSRPAPNLDNVAITAQITNESDRNAALGQGFGLQLLDYSSGNGAFRLYYTGSYPGKEEPSGTPVKTWDLVKTADGRQTVVLEPGLCTQNGWYTLWLVTSDVNSDLPIEQKLGQFFMDATVLDVSAVSIEKSYTTGSGSTIEWNIAQPEQVQTEEGEIRLGLAAAPEGWSLDKASMTFTNTTRPDEDPASPTEMAMVRVYNQTYNVSKGLAMDAGEWRKVNAKRESDYIYDLYAADLTEESPYILTDGEGSSIYRMPMLAGRNLIVYEIQSTNGTVTSHEIVVDVALEPEAWELAYELKLAEGTDMAISAEVWPVGARGEALELNVAASLDRSRYHFRETDSRNGAFVSSYTYEKNVEDKEYFLMDLYGNISTRMLTITDDAGNVRIIDSRPPEWIGFTNDYTFPDYAAMHDSSQSGDTFYFEVYAWDNDSRIDPRDVTLTFDAEYSAVLPQVGGILGEDGRFTMTLPLALDENGELLKNEDGTYAVWECMDTNHNGIFKTQVLEAEREGYPGYISIAVVGTWKYDETLTDTTRTITVNVPDAHKNIKSADLQWSANNDPYMLGIYAADQGYGFGALNADGVLGLISDVPFVTIEGYGAGEMVQIIDSWAGFRNYYTEAPMITKDSPVIGEDEYGDPIYDSYRFTVTDLFGETYTLGYTMNMYGDLGIDVEFSTTEPTNKPVTVYAAATGNIEKITSIIASDGTVGVIDPADPGNAHIVLEDNCTVTIQTDAGNERVVRVSNIDKVLGEAYITYYDENHNALRMDSDTCEVTAVLCCDTEYLYATNGADTYTFPAGSRAGDSYTFEYRDSAGNMGTITAVLPMDLKAFEGEDSEAPDVNVSLYAGSRSGFDLIERYKNPEYDETAGESELTARMNDSAVSGVRAKTVRLVLSIQDSSAVKVLAVPAGAGAPADYASAVQGSTVEGVTLTVNRNTATIDVTKNVAFDLYVIDEADNVNANRMVRITVIDDQAPQLLPSYSVSTDPVSGSSVVTATFYPTGEDLFTEITALSADAESRQEIVKDTDGKTVTVTRYYYVFDGNGTYTFRYEDDLGNIGEAIAEVKGLNTDPARVISTAWYGTKQGVFSNVLPAESDPVNRNVTAQLRMSKPVSGVELFIYDARQPDGIGAALPADACVQASCNGSVIDVIYEGNMDDQIVIRFASSGNGRTGTVVLPAVECIDKEMPKVTLENAELSQDKRSIRFRFASSEPVLFSEDLEKGSASTHEWIAIDDASKMLYFTDKAGNQCSYLVTDFFGLDDAYLQISFSASATGAEPTDEPGIDLELNVGDTLYVYVSKTANANLNGTELGQFSAGEWNPLVLPDEPGVHMLKLTDVNTGDVIDRPVFAKAVDRIAPVITFDRSTVLVNQGASSAEMLQAVHEGVNVTDNMDTGLTCNVTGCPASTQETGLHTLTYTAQDSAGNQITASRYLYILDEGTPILLINGEVGLPYSTVYLSSNEIGLAMQNMDQFADQPVVIKYAKGMLTTGQMKYSGAAVEDMHFQVDENGYYTIYIRAQDRTELVTYIYVEG